VIAVETYVSLVFKELVVTVARSARYRYLSVRTVTAVARGGRKVVAKPITGSLRGIGTDRPMMESGVPPLSPLAPIVGRLLEPAVDELPGPRTSRVERWDDGTFDARVYHSAGEEQRLCVRYESTTGETIAERWIGAGWSVTELTGGETVYEPGFDEIEAEVLEPVQPPYH
jgi:hypothetical protein